MNHYLILRLTNAAIDCDQRGQGNLAALITEAIDELEKQAAEIRRQAEDLKDIGLAEGE